MQAFVFPGQGSQYVGMGKDLYDSFPVARAVFAEADEALGFALSRLCFEGPESDLVLTENTQPALLTMSIAALRALQESEDVAPALLAGHSLGEYSAVVAAGGMSLVDAVRLVRLRGRFMQQAVPVGEGAMAAVLGLDLDVLSEVCSAEAGGQVVQPANLNAPGQIVVAGHREAVARVCETAVEAGASRAIILPVSAPFHCRLMLPAQQRLAEELEKTSIQDLAIPLVNNVDARVVTAANDVRDGLIRQVSGAVRWSDVIRAMAERRVTRLVEIGAGRVLSGLARRIDRSLKSRSVGSSEQVRDYARV